MLTLGLMILLLEPLPMPEAGAFPILEGML